MFKLELATLADLYQLNEQRINDFFYINLQLRRQNKRNICQPRSLAKANKLEKKREVLTINHMQWPAAEDSGSVVIAS